MTELITEVRPTDSGSLSLNMPKSVRRILVVEDHADTRALLRYIFERHQYEVGEATDGVEAVQLSETMLPDLILMDTSLNKMDGFEATRRIRGAGSIRNVPIVFLSGHAQPQARALAMDCGANEYLVKPISLEELEIVTERLLSGPRENSGTGIPGSSVDRQESLSHPESHTDGQESLSHTATVKNC